MLFSSFIFLGVLLIFTLWPRTKVSFDKRFNVKDIGGDVEEYLRLTENKDKYLHTWAKKKIFWYS